MKEKIAYGLWTCLYILCVGLAFVPEPQGIGKAALVLVSLIFFVPGLWLLVEGLKKNDRKMLLRLRIVSICSLALTLIFLVLFFLTVTSAVGEVIAHLLILFSAPMFCAQYWALSLFLWASLLMGTIFIPAKKAV